MNDLENGRMSSDFDSEAWLEKFCQAKTTDELYALQNQLPPCMPEEVASLTYADIRKPFITDR